MRNRIASPANAPETSSIAAAKAGFSTVSANRTEQDSWPVSQRISTAAAAATL